MRSWLLVLAAIAALLLGGCRLLTAPHASTLTLIAVAPVEAASDAELETAREVIEQRLTSAGINADVSLADETILILLADQDDRERAQRLATTPGRLDLVPVPPEYNELVFDGEPLPEGMDATPLLTGDQITVAKLGEEATTGQPAIDFELEAEAARTFDEHAAGHQGQRFAIVLDGRVVSAPSINAPQFNGRGQISGAFSQEAAEELVAVLTAGALLIALEVTTVETTEGSPRPT